jgi:cytochrome c
MIACRPPRRSTSLLAIAWTVGACGRPPLAPEAARAEAQRVWIERCATCHGERGQSAPSSRDNARSARRRPPVWHRGQ